MTRPELPMDQDYLWDPAAPADPDVHDVETRLAPLAFDPARHPFVAPPPSRRRRPAVLVAALAAGLLLAAGFAYYQWRLDWPAGRAWSVTTHAAASGGAATSAHQLEVGQPLDVAAPLTSARIDVARLGTIDAAAGTSLTVASTTARRHRVEMTRGTVDVRLWAPPGSVAIHTPAGDVIDLGCIFELTVDNDLTRLAVRTGWVQLSNHDGESLVPAGASSLMTPGRRPLVPVYDDATPAFTAAVRALEQQDGAADALATIVGEARTRDVVTVLMLALREPPATRAALVARAAALSPPPAAVDLAAGSSNDNQVLWTWIDSLPLPPVKSWWRNWRDALPRWR